MAESRGSLLAKSVQKHAGRAKEKILQNLGKVDRTADEIFDEHLQNFTKQQNAANRIQKEFNNYIRCIRAAQAASKSLLEAISDTYESQWNGHDLLYVQMQSIEMLWHDFSHKLADQVLLPLNTYQSQFPEMRKKIDKRGRKLVDFDSQRHSFQALQTNMKKKDDGKIARGREQLEEAKRTYEVLNSELHDELPALYDSRIIFLVSNLQSLFNAEQVFHCETAKVYGQLEAIVDKLATDSQRGSYNVKKVNGTSLPRSLNNSNNSNNNKSPIMLNNISSLAVVPNNKPGILNHNADDEHSTAFTSTTTKSYSENGEPEASVANSANSVMADHETTTKGSLNNSNLECNSNGLTGSGSSNISLNINNTSTPAKNNHVNSSHSINEKTSDSFASNEKPTSRKLSLDAELNLQPAGEGSIGVIAERRRSHNVESNGTPIISETLVTALPATVVNSTATDKINLTNNLNASTNSLNNVDKKLDEVRAPTSAGVNTENLPPGVLYKVKATYKYIREDVDELSFDVGEIIQVVEYDDPEEQEDGWLMGIRESTREKGMFPANFTCPL